jgi:hypothetical protein
MEKNGDRGEKGKKGTSDAAPDSRDTPMPEKKRRESQPDAGLAVSEAVHDAAIKEAVTDIHG